jgi:hypothetical protein
MLPSLNTDEQTISPPSAAKLFMDAIFERQHSICNTASLPFLHVLVFTPAYILLHGS